MTSTLNQEQMSAVLCQDKKILCLAGAGCGKTHTMLERISHLVDTGVDPLSILVLTFTNAAAFEMKSRYQNSHSSVRVPDFRTFHSFCYHVLSSNAEIRRNLGYLETPSIADENTSKRIRREAQTITGIKSTIESLEKKQVRTKSEQNDYELLKKASSKLMKQRNTITFDELCSKVCNFFKDNSPLVDYYKRKYKYIFVDEFQDTDPIQYDFVKSFTDSYLFFVGDALQCQPAGTVVTMSDMTYKNIEDLRVGDYVLTYVPKEGRYVQNLRYKSGNKLRYAKQITAISTHYATNVVKVVSTKHQSCYTKDHITYAKIHYEGNEDSYVTYLMHSPEGWWRVGSTKLFLDSQGTAFGPRLRMQNEHGDKVWILGVYKSTSEAWLNEQLAAYKYGIPQTTWNYENVRYSKDDIRKLYNILGDLSDNASSCLHDYGRDIEYPLFTKGDLHTHFSKLHLFECRIGNLIPGIFDIVCPEYIINNAGYEELRNSYEVVISIEPQPDQIVYGLDVEMNHNYVGDGILTHNCLYSFRGADSSIIKRLAVDPEWTTIKMYKNYRSTGAVCDFANENSKYADDSFRIAIVPGKGDPGEPVICKPYKGSIMYGDIDEKSKEFCLEDAVSLPGSTAILFRTNREVEDFQHYCDAHDVKYRSGKRSMDIENILLSIGDNDYLLNWLSTYLNAEKYADYIRVSTLTQGSDIPYDIVAFKKDYGTIPAISERWEIVRLIRRICKDKEKSIVDRFRDVLSIIGCNADKIDESRCSTMKDAVDYALEIYKGTTEEPGTDIYIGTVHSVKGLEFDNVYVFGVDGSTFKLNNEENNNIYYVAITRAKKHLVVLKNERLTF